MPKGALLPQDAQRSLRRVIEVEGLCCSVHRRGWSEEVAKKPIGTAAPSLPMEKPVVATASCLVPSIITVEPHLDLGRRCLTIVAQIWDAAPS
jgi:hypothetical protein